MNCTIFATLGSLLAGGTLAFGMLFHTGFENHDYTVGQPLAGQDGWVALASANAAVVVGDHNEASSGRRAVRCWGGDLEDFPSSFLYDGVWEQVVPFDPITNPCEVRVEADVRLVGPDTGTGPGDDLVSANLMARNSVGLHRSPFMYLSSNGNVYAGSESDQGNAYYRFETPIRFGEYNELAMTLNYLTHIATFEVNGREIGSLPFGGAGEQWHGVLLEMAAYDDPNYVDPTLYTGYWDNVRVISRPASRCRH
jgi:hypothetical protein